MKVILKEKVKSLGNVGEIHNVSAGYARNYLIKNNLATLADEGNTKALTDQKKALAKKIETEKTAALDLKKKLDGYTITLEKKVGGSGRLFGTVTSSELSELLNKNGLEVEKRAIVIERPIKQLGNFEVTARLFSEVEAVFNVKVEKDAKQVAEDAKKAAAKAKKAAKKEEKKADEASEEGSKEEVATESAE